MRERRKNPRRQVYKVGLLSFGVDRVTLPCRMLDLSISGALISVADPKELPDLVTFYFDRLDEQRLEVVSAWCAVIPGDQRKISLRFLATPSRAASLPGVDAA